ncbi:hypothetical protein M404DRAFT_1002147 [Pisolithus tinctorius Marx 270]|uniref:Uncharacterized protein n=1 Tax=Pisolithus tinctorius Marx 270 TaxID=870435 RepID=A0A0C3J0B5_PISTI|nr:hypothetical protein M404DRAFT_1002147 [Pisolithus tinctorius Marx 270]
MASFINASAECKGRNSKNGQSMSLVSKLSIPSIAIPSTLKHSDTVLCNWELKKAPFTGEVGTESDTLNLDNLKSHGLFIATRDEFYFASACIELTRASMDEMSVGDDILYPDPGERMWRFGGYREV